MTGTAPEKFAHLASLPDAQEAAETPTPQQIIRMLDAFSEFGTFECTTHGMAEPAAAFKRREYDCAILAEVAQHLPSVPNTTANADFLRHHLNGHSMNTNEGKKAMWELIMTLPEENHIRQAFLIPSPYDDDLTDPKIIAIPREEYVLSSDNLEFEGDKPACTDYRVFQFPELS